MMARVDRAVLAVAIVVVEGLVWLAEVLEARRHRKDAEAASRDAQGY